MKVPALPLQSRLALLCLLSLPACPGPEKAWESPLDALQASDQFLGSQEWETAGDAARFALDGELADASRAWARINLGLAQVGMKELEAAESSFAAAEAEAGHTASAAERICRAWLNLGEIERCRLALERAEGRFPNSEAPWLQLGLDLQKALEGGQDDHLREIGYVDGEDG